jgi:hypothetical protein
MEKRKWNAVVGYLATLSLLQVFEDALHALLEINDPLQFMDDMKQLEENFVNKFYQSEPSSEQYLKNENFVSSTMTQSSSVDVPASNKHLVNISLLAKSRSICHTALLPAEIRNKGILTETYMNNDTTDSLIFDTGIEFEQAMANLNHDDYSIRVVYQDQDRYRIRTSPNLTQDHIDCPYKTFIDYKDSFLLHYGEGWKSLILPNDAELKVYGGHMVRWNESATNNNDKQQQQQQYRFQGYIMICFLTICPYHNCPPNSLKAREAYQKQQLLLQVNNISVTELIQIKECDLLAHNESIVWPLHPITGKYHIQVKVLEENYFLRISSIITW